jgi:hypothetical protein
MKARDSSGRQVSLLNDVESSSSQCRRPQFHRPTYSYDHSSMVRSPSNTSQPSSPCTPGLMRADSYDSVNTNDPRSPLTPISLGDYGRQSSYSSVASYQTQHYDPRERISSFDDYSSQPQYTVARPSYADSRSSSFTDSHMYDDDSYGNRGVSQKGGKRYPCRYRDSHGCNKSFTTSGHASRHSKIHTAEKAVHCTFQGCQKKFTRADNMKQHLETHYKERSRSSAAAKPTPSKLTIPASFKKPLSTGRSSRPSRPELPPIDPGLYASYSAHATYLVVASPASPYGSLGDMSGIQHALSSQPMEPVEAAGVLATIHCAGYRA